MVVVWIGHVGQTRDSLKLDRASILPDSRGFLVVTVSCLPEKGGMVKGSLVAQYMVFLSTAWRMMIGMVAST